MDAFTSSTATKTEEPVLPPVNDDTSNGSNGGCVVCREDTTFPAVNEDSGRGSNGGCVIA
jgi:hypothetical protein